MDRPSKATCDKCGYPIEVVMSVMPSDDKPGIYAWVCSHCGDRDSVLTYRTHQTWPRTETR
jgi:predicted nucleic acid-binding Zn ribbon protein